MCAGDVLTGTVITALAAALLIAVLMAMFGLPPVDLHPPLHRVGIMDPLQPASPSRTSGGVVWRYNPAGILVLIAAAMAIARGITGLMFARWP